MGKTSKQNRKEVTVVSAQSGFPVSNKQRDIERAAAAPLIKRKGPKLLDWHETAKEVKAFGSQGFVKKSKRAFEEEEYKRITGRDKPKEKIPWKIAKGIQKKARAREARSIEEAKAAGIVLPTPKKVKKVAKDGKAGPAPSIGFLKDGVLRVKPRR